MIKFRCPCCNRLHQAASNKIGTRLLCSCQETLRVPARSWESARYRSVGDRLIEISVYGAGGAFLGVCLGLLCLRLVFRLGSMGLWWWGFLAGCAALGFVAGGLGGERGIEWIGRMIRDRDDAA
jgi:hypothetical protein